MKRIRESIKSIDNKGRLQPQAIDCEESVIGALLLEKRAFETISPILRSEMFYNKSNEEIYKAILQLDREQKPIDMLTIIKRLGENGILEDIGGAYYIAQLSQKVVSSSHCEYHAKIVAQKYLAREVIRISNELSLLAYDETQDAEEILQEAEKQLLHLRDNSTDSTGVIQLSESLSGSLSQMYERIEKYKKGETQGVTTGLADLNKITCGWQSGELIIIAARPAMGKTAFALHFTKTAAQSGIPVAVFSMEMSNISLSNRFLLSESNVNPEIFKSGRLTSTDTDKIEQTANKLRNLSIHIDDNPCNSIAKIRAKARLLQKKGKCGMIVIDYLQLAESDDRTGNREQEVALISRNAKKMARELKIPVILLSQLSRKVEDRTDKRPMLSDLRESGAIEQDADMVCFLYRPEYYNRETKDSKGNTIKNYVEFIIAKYREGSTQSIDVIHNGTMTKIFDYDNKGHTSNQALENYYEPKHIQNSIPF